MSTEFLTNEMAGSKPQTPQNLENNLSNDTDFISAKSYLLTASTKTGLNM